MIYQNGGGETRQTTPKKQPPKRKGWIPGWYLWLSIIMLIAVVFFLGNAAGARRDALNAKIREKLPSEACVVSDVWMEDDLGWISSKRTVQQGMEYFYERTGIQPYLLVSDSLGGISAAGITDAQAENALKELYDSLYQDEGHMIFTFLEYAPSQYVTYLYTGRSADSVMDADAREIFLDNADNYYTDSSLSDEAFFAKVFANSADQIMKDPSRSTAMAIFYVAASGAILLILAGGLIAFKLREQRMKETEQVKKVLETPFGSSAEDEELERKYGEKKEG